MIYEVLLAIFSSRRLNLGCSTSEVMRLARQSRKVITMRVQIVRPKRLRLIPARALRSKPPRTATWGSGSGMSGKAEILNSLGKRPVVVVAAWDRLVLANGFAVGVNGEQYYLDIFRRYVS